MIFLLALLCVAAADLTLPIEYSLDDWQTSATLGNIVVREAYNGNFTGTFKPSLESNVLGNALQNAPKSIYRIRTQQPEVTASSSAKPCALLDAKLVHSFWVSLDQSGKFVQSLTVFPDTAFATGDTSCKLQPKSSLAGIVQIVGTEQLKSPDTQSFIEKMEKERRARQHGAETDNRSFLAKYWMYIVPVVIFMAISSMGQQQEGGAQ
ncbi:unnamed protein product, partial [Mesorhabditis spiculigera]